MRLNQKLKTKNSKLPFVFVNMAMTADGKIATASRAVHSFGSARDLQHLYELRATADAVMCGAQTVEISQSILGTVGEKLRRLRIRNRLAEYNLRIIVSGSGSIDPKAEIFQKKFSPIIVLTTERAPDKKLNRLRAVADEVKICGNTKINFRNAFRWLQAKWNVKRLLCEGGGELNGSLFRAGLVDEVHLTICPIIFGGQHAPTIADGLGADDLKNAAGFRRKSVRRIKDELFTVWTRGISRPQDH
jgi:2,5-diamino-6-(ribosylamino)-4(3H)-pyrimidinone 5'-phosphate reductase